MSKTRYYVLYLTFVDGIEQQFQVDLRLRTAGLAGCYDGIALQGGFGIEHILHLVGRAILEGVFLLNLSYRGVEQQFLGREDEDMVQQRLDIVHLMGGDDVPKRTT